MSGVKMKTYLSVQRFFAISVFTSLLGTSVTQVGCGSGDVRVVNGFIPNDGRVEVCQNDSWIPVCDGGWGNNDARVVCRQLGFAEGSVGLDPRFGSSSGSQYITDVRCVGSEARLVDCELVTGPLCDPQNTAIALCTYNGAPLLYSSRQLYQNNSLINSQDVDNVISSAVLCLTNRFPCCTDIDDGSWYDPNGLLLPDGTGIFEIPTAQRFYRSYFNRQVVALYHSIEGSDGISEGLFHCQIFDRENVAQYLYIGIYSSGNGSPTVSNVAYNSSTQTLVCTSTGGPATSVTWSRDDTPLVVDGTTYEHSQIITDTNTATYQNRLRIVRRSLQTHLYTCTVSNLRGNDTAQLVVPACDIGEVNFTAAGTINAFCFNGTWYEVPTAGGQGSGVVFEVLFAASMLALVAAVAIFVVWVLKSKKKTSYTIPPTGNVDIDNRYVLARGQSMVLNGRYGEDSMADNLAYNSVQIRAETNLDSYEAVSAAYESVEKQDKGESTAQEREIVSSESPLPEYSNLHTVTQPTEGNSEFLGPGYDKTHAKHLVIQVPRYSQLHSPTQGIVEGSEPLHGFGYNQLHSPTRNSAMGSLHSPTRSTEGLEFPGPGYSQLHSPTRSSTEGSELQYSQLHSPTPNSTEGLKLLVPGYSQLHRNSVGTESNNSAPAGEDSLGDEVQYEVPSID